MGAGNRRTFAAAGSRTPLHLGEPSTWFPQAWTITRWVPGEPVDRVPLTDANSADDLADLQEGFVERLTRVRELVDAPAARRVWAAARRAKPWTGEPVWLHADLHPANVVGEDGRLAGVLDFGDLCAGDPAADVAAAWLLLPTTAAVQQFLEHVTDDDLLARARGWASRHGLGLISIGIDGELGRCGGRSTWRTGGTRAVELLLS